MPVATTTERPGLRGFAPDTLGRLFSRAASRFGDRLAVTDRDGRSRTYAELAARGARLANALRGLGVRPGDRVAAMLEDRTESVEVYVGTALAGAVLVHVNARNQAPEVAYQLDHSGARALVHTDGVSAAVDAVDGRSELAGTVTIGTGDRPAGALGYERLLGAASTRPPAEERTAEDVAIIGYTSGTTGRPKGAAVSHRAAVGCARCSPYVYRIPPASRMAYSGSLSFVATVWGQVFPHLWLGGAVDLLGRLDVDRWVDRIATTRATFTYVPSPLVVPFTERVAATPAALDALRVVFHTGSPVPRPHVEACVGVVGSRWIEVWGMTEAVGALTVTSADDFGGASAADDVLSSVGRPVPMAGVDVLDANGAPLPPGEIGELVAETDTLFSGYWNDPAGTDAVLRDGRYHTGDLGFRDPAGYVYVAGRRQDLIVSGGMNVYPAEVERVVRELPGVADVAVFGVDDARWGEAVAAAVVAEPAAGLTAERVTDHVVANLASYKKPRHVVLVDDLPRNASLKVDRAALRALARRGDEQGRGT